NPLDNSAVHPESYHIVEAMAAKTGSSVSELVQKKELRQQVQAKDFVTAAAGLYTIEDILKELEKPGRDPRAPIEEFRFAEGINTMEDLQPGMKLPGIVTNITNFGAFVNIGVKQDGLVHISHLSNRFITDPNEAVKLNDKVMVSVLEVDVARKRIALSIKEAMDRKPNEQQRNKNNKPKTGNTPAPKNDFQAKLMELKKKFG
ncbi:MAG: S1 RNA-binding domain-containing protein, partial [Dinghuibacter sp.]|nr:S1 RNA-binding domain-containing protein [Dinghuibacter sp.]